MPLVSLLFQGIQVTHDVESFVEEIRESRESFIFVHGGHVTSPDMFPLKITKPVEKKCRSTKSWCLESYFKTSYKPKGEAEASIITDLLLVRKNNIVVRYSQGQGHAWCFRKQKTNKSVFENIRYTLICWCKVSICCRIWTTSISII